MNEEQIQERLEQLRQEYSKGQEMLNKLQAEEAELQQQLLRISGAIQVLEELVNQKPPEDAGQA